MIKKKNDLSMITKSSLKSERGWTDKLIKMFASDPDLTKPNPNYKSAAPMLLFDIKRIERIEKTKKFKLEKLKAIERKDIAKKAVGTKLKNLRNWLEVVNIYLPIYEKKHIIQQACDHYNDMQELRESEGRSTCGMIATIHSERKFLERICVNYLRHSLTKYEEYLDEISGKVGFDEGYYKIRQKIYEKISKNYPWLTQECKRQQGLIEFQDGILKDENLIL